jgi:uncharacterized lipoprotein YajG
MKLETKIDQKNRRNIMFKLVVFALSIFVVTPAFADVTSLDSLENDIIKAGDAIIDGKTVVLTTSDGKTITLSTPTVREALKPGES